MVWLLGFTFTSPQSRTAVCLRLIHAFTGCVSQLIHLWLSCKTALTLSPKNMLAVALGHGDILVVASAFWGKKGNWTAHKKDSVLRLYRL